MRFVALEGVDGSGKSSAARRLESYPEVYCVKTPPVGFMPELHARQLANPSDIPTSKDYTVLGLLETCEQIRHKLVLTPNIMVVSERYFVGTFANLLAQAMRYAPAYQSDILYSMEEIRKSILLPSANVLLSAAHMELLRRRDEAKKALEFFDTDEELLRKKEATYGRLMAKERERGVPLHVVDTTNSSVGETAGIVYRILRHLDV